MSTGLLIARLVFGALIATHGAQKLFGWFGGYGLSGTGGFFEGLGFRPGRLFAMAAGLTEFVGGLLLLIGLFAPAGAAAIISVMIVAIGSVHWRNGLLATTNGVELPLLYGAAAMCLALTGPGAYSIDHAFGLTSWWTPRLTGIVVVLAIAGGFVPCGGQWRKRRGPSTGCHLVGCEQEVNVTNARTIVRRTSGSRHGPITRLMSPSDLGQVLKPFVFLDHFELHGAAGGTELHPHSGIATVTYLFEGTIRYEDSDGATGVVPAGGVEWFRAAHGAWHAGGPGDTGRARGFQLWLALPPASR
jgi:uncharacterized membrane protein YphA (DoxX/SURF4 family)